MDALRSVLLAWALRAEEQRLSFTPDAGRDWDPSALSTAQEDALIDRYVRTLLCFGRRCGLGALALVHPSLHCLTIAPLSFLWVP